MKKEPFRVKTLAQRKKLREASSELLFDNPSKTHSYTLSQSTPIDLLKKHRTSAAANKAWFELGDYKNLMTQKNGKYNSDRNFVHVLKTAAKELENKRYLGFTFKPQDNYPDARFRIMPFTAGLDAIDFLQVPLERGNIYITGNGSQGAQFAMNVPSRTQGNDDYQMKLTGIPLRYDSKDEQIRHLNIEAENTHGDDFWKLRLRNKVHLPVHAALLYLQASRQLETDVPRMMNPFFWPSKKLYDQYQIMKNNVLIKDMKTGKVRLPHEVELCDLVRDAIFYHGDSAFYSVKDGKLDNYHKD